MVVAPIIPATQEAATEESLEPGRWRLQWEEITLLRSRLGDKSEIPSQKWKKKLEERTGMPAIINLINYYAAGPKPM